RPASRGPRHPDGRARSTDRSRGHSSGRRCFRDRASAGRRAHRAHRTRPLMPTNVIMPALEMAQETGKVVRWLKSPGDTVRKGEPILEIETDKVTVEIESPAA